MARPPQGSLIIAINGRWHRPSTLAIPARYAYEQQIPMHVVGCPLTEEDRQRQGELQDLFLRSIAVISSQHPDLEVSLEVMVHPTAEKLTAMARESSARVLGLGPALVCQPEVITLFEDVVTQASCKVALYPNRHDSGPADPVVVAVSPALPPSAHLEAVAVACRFAEPRDQKVRVITPAPAPRGFSMFKRRQAEEPAYLQEARAAFPERAIELVHAPAGTTVVAAALSHPASMLVTTLPDATEEAANHPGFANARPSMDPVSADVTNDELINHMRYGYLLAAGMPVVVLPTEITGSGCAA